MTGGRAGWPSAQRLSQDVGGDRRRQEHEQRRGPEAIRVEEFVFDKGLHISLLTLTKTINVFNIVTNSIAFECYVSTSCFGSCSLTYMSASPAEGVRHTTSSRPENNTPRLLVIDHPVPPTDHSRYNYIIFVSLHIRMDTTTRAVSDEVLYTWVC